LAEAAARNAAITPALQAFVEANATRPFAQQLALPLWGRLARSSDDCRLTRREKHRQNSIIETSLFAPAPDIFAAGFLRLDH